VLVALTCGLSVLLVGLDGCEVRLCGPFAFVRARVSRVSRVNVNTTDATAGATALLLPAQNTHTLHDPKRDT
jgi:hypothetical protein